jgi:hypothetical protein
MNPMIQGLFDLTEEIRYVAVYREGKLESSQRPGLSNASGNESDTYEELIVNPTLLKLVTQRGNIDCGGCRFVLIRYGNFFQYVAPIQNGHISVSIDLHADPIELSNRINECIEQNEL